MHLLYQNCPRWQHSCSLNSFPTNDVSFSRHDYPFRVASLITFFSVLKSNFLITNSWKFRILSKIMRKWYCCKILEKSRNFMCKEAFLVDNENNWPRFNGWLQNHVGTKSTNLLNCFEMTVSKLETMALKYFLIGPSSLFSISPNSAKQCSHFSPKNYQTLYQCKG